MAALHVLRLVVGLEHGAEVTVEAHRVQLVVVPFDFERIAAIRRH